MVDQAGEQEQLVLIQRSAGRHGVVHQAFLYSPSTGVGYSIVATISVNSAADIDSTNARVSRNAADCRVSSSSPPGVSCPASTAASARFRTSGIHSTLVSSST